MAELEYGVVRGRYRLVQSNVSRSAVGTVLFTAVEPDEIVDVPEETLYSRQSVEAVFDGDGWIHAAGTPVDYLRLPVGRWEVSFRNATGLSITPFKFDVTADETVNLPAIAPIKPSPDVKFVVNELVYTETLDARDETFVARDVAVQAAADAVAPTNTVVDARIALKRGAANGVAALGSDSKLPETQVPDRLSAAQLSSTIGAAVAPKANTADVYSKTAADAAIVAAPSTSTGFLTNLLNRLTLWFATLFGVAIATDTRWGLVMDGVTDNSAKINDMLQAVYSNGGGFLGSIAYFPPGTYIGENIALRSRVMVMGAGKRATIFKPPANGSADAVFTLRPGPVQSSFLRNLSVEGNGVAGQHGIHLIATAGSGGNGGWWESGMKNVRVSGFLGHQIWLEGGVGGLLPHQFLKLEHVEAFSIGGLRSLNVTNQVGQVTYDTCQFDGDGISAADGEMGASVYLGALSYAHTFINTTFQENLYGIIVDGASPVTLMGSYWENIGRAVYAKGGTRLVRVLSPSLSNAAHVSDNSGYIFRAEAASFIVWDSVKAGGTVDRIQSTDSNSVISGTTYLGPTAPAAGSSGVTKNIAESSGTITLNTAGTTFLVNGSANTITTIAGAFRSPGEQVRLKAHGGSIVFGQTGNISVGKLSGTLTVPADAWVTLVRVDSGGKDWVVVGMSPA